MKNYKIGDKRVFPYSKTNETMRFNRLLKQSGTYAIDRRTRRSMIHSHIFRKFFLTEFKLSASAEVAEELAGHTGYLSYSYRRITHQTMCEEYLRAEPRLTIRVPEIQTPPSVVHQKMIPSPHIIPIYIQEELEQMWREITRLQVLYHQIQMQLIDSGFRVISK